MTDLSAIVEPMDRYNQILVSNLHPPEWQNPLPAKRYNLVVIGGGTAGLVTAAGAGLLGAKVAMVEKHLLGGDCTNFGCVPSKTLIHSGRAAAEVRQAGNFGVRVPDGVQVDFPQVMERLRQVRAEISHHDSARRFQEEFNVDVFLGAARFASAQVVEVNGQRLPFQKAAIATGTRPKVPNLPGLQEIGYLTNETVFSLTERPERLAIIGGGYIGCELAQTFQRLGSQVILLQRSPCLLPRSDRDASRLIEEVLRRERVEVYLKAEVQRVEVQGRQKRVIYQVNGQEQSAVVGEILVAVGRAPNVEGLNLEAAGVNCDRQGIQVNDFLQTSNRHIYAVGDVCLRERFTHVADASARIALQNALFSLWGIGRKRYSSLVIPWCTYTDPEIAHVGATAAEIAEKGAEIDTLHVSLSQVDRAIAQGETEGFAKIHLRRGTDKIVGATVVARNAGDMINEISLVMANGLGLGAIAKTIHPYPTQAEVIRKVANAYQLRQLSGRIKKLASVWLAWRR